jgi:hypothetical protein
MGWEKHFLFYCFFGFLILQTVLYFGLLLWEIYELLYSNTKTNDVGPK